MWLTVAGRVSWWFGNGGRGTHGLWFAEEAPLGVFGFGRGLEVEEVGGQVGETSDGVRVDVVLVGVFLFEGFDAGHVGGGEGFPELRRVGPESGGAIFVVCFHFGLCVVARGELVGGVEWEIDSQARW